MKRKHRTAQTSKPSGRAIKQNERQAEAGTTTPLPRRMAMSILSGLPTIPIGGSSPIDLINGGAGTTPSTDPSTTPVTPDVDPSASAGDIQQNSPLNQATVTNVNSADTVETASAAQQVTPIEQGNS